MVYCAAMMKDEAAGGAKAGYLLVEITALYLKRLEEIFNFPSTAFPLLKGVFRDEGAVFMPQAAFESADLKTLDLLAQISDVRVVPLLPKGLSSIYEHQRRGRGYQCEIEALPPRHGRKLFSWRAVPLGLTGFGDTPGYRSQAALLDRGSIQSLSEMIGSLLNRI
jgi:hypothetical protein